MKDSLLYKTMKKDKTIPLMCEEQVTDFLLQNPSFFNHHPYLLTELNLPQKNGKIIPISQKQLMVLREENAVLQNQQAQLEQKISTLIEIVKNNEALSVCLHRLSLKLIAASNVETIISETLPLLKKQFPANQILIRLFAPFSDLSDTALTLDKQDPVLEMLLTSMFNVGRPDCGPFGGAVKKALFGNFAQRISSAVAMPLYTENHKLGLLLFGSPRVDAFAPGKSTMILVKCGELIATTIENRAIAEGILNGSTCK